MTKYRNRLRYYIENMQITTDKEDTMSKHTSRTVHVTVTLSVEVPEHEANTDIKARLIAQQVWRQRGSEFDCTAKVFERETEEENKAVERHKFRGFHITKGR